MDEVLALTAKRSVRGRVDPPSAVAGSNRYHQVRDEVGFGALVDVYRRGLELGVEVDRDVAASVVVQAVVSHTAAPVLVAGALGHSLEVRLEDVVWRHEGPGVRFGWAAAGIGPGLSAVVDTALVLEHLVGPWIEAAGGMTDLPARQLWGNATAGVWTAVVERHRVSALGAAELNSVHEVIELSSPFGSLLQRLAGDPDPTRYQRTTCCQLAPAGLAPCEECPLVREANR